MKNRMPLHLLDELPRLVLWLKVPRFKIFPEGWGAPLSQLNQLFHLPKHYKIPEINIRWSHKKIPGPFSIREGTFRVPESEHLPEKIRHAHFREILPPSPSQKICLLLAGWGDHGYNLRMRLARVLHRKGIGTLLLENPYHGRRYLEERPGPPVFSVKELGWLARAACSEGMALVQHYKNQGFEIGISGFSMGGGFAGTIAVLLPYPLPTTLLAAPPSAEIPLLEGVMGKGIDWRAFSSTPHPKEKIRRLFRRVSLLNAPPPPKGSRIILFGAKKDKIVLASSIRKLHRHWKGSQLRWREGGHLSLWLFEVEAMAESIRESFGSSL